jgi:hypothetical protein
MTDTPIASAQGGQTTQDKLSDLKMLDDERNVLLVEDLLSILAEIVAISDRDHVAWRRAKALIEKTRRHPVNNGWAGAASFVTPPHPPTVGEGE